MTALEDHVLRFLRQQHASYGGLRLAEQAVPSYVHSNPLVAATFWRRIRIAVKLTAQNRQIGNVLDFGAGTGLILPFLSQNKAEKVYALEPEAHARDILTQTIQEFQLPNVSIVRDWCDLRELPAGSIDTVTALDVFEHIENLEEVLKELHRLMSSKAVMVVSSPTETWFYKLARSFGGPEYSGHYHVSDAQKVEAALAKYFDVRLAARLYPGLVFFRIVACAKR